VVLLTPRSQPPRLRHLRSLGRVSFQDFEQPQEELSYSRPIEDLVPLSFFLQMIGPTNF
jgi:hypothetical protein